MRRLEPRLRTLETTNAATVTHGAARDHLFGELRQLAERIDGETDLAMASPAMLAACLVFKKDVPITVVERALVPACEPTVYGKLLRYALDARGVKL